MQSVKDLLEFIEKNFEFDIREKEDYSYIRYPTKWSKAFMELIEEVEKESNK